MSLMVNVKLLTCHISRFVLENIEMCYGVQHVSKCVKFDKTPIMLRVKE